MVRAVQGELLDRFQDEGFARKYVCHREGGVVAFGETPLLAKLGLVKGTQYKLADVETIYVPPPDQVEVLVKVSASEELLDGREWSDLGSSLRNLASLHIPGACLQLQRASFNTALGERGIHLEIVKGGVSVSEIGLFANAAYCKLMKGLQRKFGQPADFRYEVSIATP